jgi:putative transposase
MVAILELLGIERSHGAIWQWRHRLADSAGDTPTVKPSRVDIDENTVEIGTWWFWLYAAGDLG